MSSRAHFDSSFEAFREQAKPRPGLGLTERFCDVSHFLLRVRVQLQFGRFSRAPLKLLSFQIRQEIVECDVLARAADPWDADLPERITRRHVSSQVLRDAVDLRALAFRAIPDIQAMLLRIYREAADGTHELIVLGHVHRNDQSARGVHSLSMRAKVLGFRFHLESDRFHKLTEESTAFRPAKR